ncbi:MAG: helix-turn-helix domain-containing protein, partial [Wujia sp.]
MDLIQIGKFIAELRKEKGLTQEQFGDKVGVTNKTVSRWETGTYLPPADVLLSISEMFHVSINEILSGKRLSDEEYKLAAENNLTQAIKNSSFTLKDKIEFYKNKWLKEHIAIMAFVGICILGVLVARFV